MNGDEVVREHTLYLLFQLHSRSWDVWTKLYQFDICDCLDVRFALLTVNESRRVCLNYKFLGEILNMC
jgi:hypothetical protein